ncbi:MAG: TIGR04282 family arsenosugar biosynthesis glycosyltransferase [Alphaproteobacteria bacterium]|nr:TIGR04282 family arsenosugar biosynthesis glycosyltransferase [Alphaproteobacteria bacterium]
MRDRHLVLFAKAPRFGMVKTRLAQDIGPMAALRFYRSTLASMGRQLGADPRWTLVLAVTPDKTALQDGLWPAGVPRIGQGGGDLGARMDRAMRLLPPGPVLIIGSDIPALRPAHVEKGFRLLERRGGVIGPTKDGGYWCVGLKRLLGVPRIFDNIDWSSGQELGQTVANMKRAGLDPGFADELLDVDTGADYAQAFS